MPVQWLLATLSITRLRRALLRTASYACHLGSLRAGSMGRRLVAYGSRYLAFGAIPTLETASSRRPSWRATARRRGMSFAIASPTISGSWWPASGHDHACPSICTAVVYTSPARTDRPRRRARPQGPARRLCRINNSGSPVRGRGYQARAGVVELQARCPRGSGGPGVALSWTPKPSPFGVRAPFPRTGRLRRRGMRSRWWPNTRPIRRTRPIGGRHNSWFVTYRLQPSSHRQQPQQVSV